MLRPIPPKILKSNAVIMVCTGVDRYQKQTYQYYNVNRVHCQRSHAVRKTVENTEYVCNAVLFIDARISRPNYDYIGFFNGAHSHGGDIRVQVNNNDYIVMDVEELRDDTDRIHHWELYLV